MTRGSVPPPPSGPADDPLDALADRLLDELGDGELDDATVTGGEADEPEPGGLDWIRSTLRRGGSEDDPLIGTLFQGKYRILRRVGRGGFGAVYEAVDERGAHNRVALKIQLPGFRGKAERLESFRAEAIRVTRLSHPNIVDWKSFDETPDGGSYFVMELVDGLPLSDVIARDAPLEWRRAAGLLLQILAALRAAHFVGEGQSILHLDLKPKNILVLPARTGRAETAKVIDFGIGQYLGEDSPPRGAVEVGAPPPVPATLPETRAAHGEEPGTLTTAVTDSREFARRAARYPFQISQAYTAEYASPEHCVHIEFANGQDVVPEPLDGRADLYSLGVIAYQLLTGRLPYPKPVHRAQWIELHRGAPVEPWTAEVEGRVPRPLRRFVERCLAKDREERFEDADEALQELERIARPSRRKRLAAAGLLLVLAGAGLAGLLAPDGGRLDLQGPDGVPVERLHVGAGGPARRARVEVAEGGTELDPKVALRLVGDGTKALAGWSVSRTGARDVELVPDADFAELHLRREAFPRTRLVSEDGAWASDPFELVWLGESTLAATAWAGDARLSTGAPLRLDPEGLTVELRLDELRALDLEPGGSKLRYAAHRLPLRALDQPGGGTWLRAELPAAPSEAALEPLELAFELQLASGERPALVHRAQPVPGPLVLEAFRVDEAGDWTPWGGGGVWRGESLRLGLRATRGATLRSDVLGVRGAALEPEDGGRFELTLDLAGALSREGGAPPSLDLHVDDGVVHAPIAAARHVVRMELPLRLLERRAFVAQLASATPSPSARPAPVPRFETEVATDGRGALPLRGFEGVEPERFELELVVDGDARGRLTPPTDDGAIDLRPVLASLGALDEGRRALVVRSWRLDAEGHREGGAPNSEARVALVVDRTPPRVALPDAGDGVLLVTPSAPEPRLVLPYPDDDGAEVLVRWRLLDEEDAPLSEWRVERATPGAEVRAAGPFRIDPLAGPPPGGGAWPDGRFVVELQALDAAGNRAAVQRVPLEIAKRGPRLVVLAPAEEVGSPVAAWAAPGGELQEIALEAFDTNGVAEVTCSVFRTGAARGGLPVVEVRALPLESAAGERGGRWRWRFLPEDPSWSLAEDVLLRFKARDARGRASTLLHGPFRLPNVRERYPDRLGDLCLVPGNADEAYVFRGRTSVVDENRAFVDAGLRPLWVAPGRERPGETQSAWAVSIAAGELPSYYLAEREVSAAELLAFVRADDGYADPTHWRVGAAPSEARRAELAAHLARLPSERPATGAWQVEAEAYARSRGARLPSLLELEYAVRAGTRYRPRSWDVGGAGALDPESPWQRLRGLSTGAEWTASPAPLDDAGGALRRRAPLPGPDAPPAAAYWISGAPAGHVLQSRAELRDDFAAVDVGDARGWSNPRVGFRLALGAREASEVLNAEERPTAAADEGARE